MPEDLSYRVGFEDGCDAIVALLEDRRDVGSGTKNAVLRFVQDLRRAKAQRILKDLVVYRRST